MGTANTACDWAVLAWRDANGDLYVLDLDRPQVKVTLDWSPPNSSQPQDLMAPAPQPIVNLIIQGQGREARRVNSHQNCIDATQRILQARRP